jgi:uncharacterized protein
LNPLRILILGFLFYIIYRLLTGGRKKIRKAGHTAVPQPHDVLVEDPVCKVCVPKKQAVILEEDGHNTYFCSQECREKFIAMKGDQR